MGNKYHALHMHLSRLSRFASKSQHHDDLGLVAAVPSIHRAAEKEYSRKPKSSLATIVLESLMELSGGGRGKKSGQGSDRTKLR